MLVIEGELEPIHPSCWQYKTFAWHHIGWNAKPYGTLSMRPASEIGPEERKLTVGTTHAVLPEHIDEFARARYAHGQEWARKVQDYRCRHRCEPPADFVPRFSIIRFFEEKFPLAIDDD